MKQRQRLFKQLVVCVLIMVLAPLGQGGRVDGQNTAAKKRFLPLVMNETAYCNSYEPNDSNPGAGPLTSGAITRAMLCEPGDFDFFYFSATTSRQLAVYLTLPPSLVNRVSLWIYNSAGDALSGTHLVTTASSVLRYDLPANGMYIVGLYTPDAMVETTQPYALRVVFAAPPPPTATITRTPTMTLSPTTTGTATRTRTRTPIASSTPTRTRTNTPLPPTPTRTPPPTATITRTPLPTYQLIVQGYNTTPPPGQAVSVQHGVPISINTALPPCPTPRFNGWTVTSGSATIANRFSMSTTVTLTNGNATITASYC